MGPDSQPRPAGVHLDSKVEGLLVSAFEGMLEESRQLGHWGDVRGTADCKMAMDLCFPRGAFAGLRTFAGDWLARRMYVTDKDKGNWEEEIWDTSIAIMALAWDKARYKDRIWAGLGWLETAYRVGRSNWNDEPWETSWALLAIHEALGPDLQSHPYGGLCHQPLHWLTSFMGIPREGMQVNAHYTGLFVLLANRFANQDILGLEHGALLDELRQAKHKAVERLITDLGTVNPHSRELWSKELWSNGLVLWGIAEAGALHETTPGLADALRWFDDALTRPSVQTEDRAFACIGLYHLLVSLRIEENLLLPSSVAAARNLLSDEGCQRVFDACLQIARREAASDTKARLGQELHERVSVKHRDFRPHPPFLETHEWEGYYTVRAHKKAANLTVIVCLTTALTVLTQWSAGGLGTVWSWLIAAIPVAAGVLATLEQLVGLSIRDLFGSKAKDQQ